MRAAIGARDDGIGGAFQLVIEATLGEPSHRRVGRGLAVQREGADVRFMPAGAYGLVHGLDDVAADAELPERRLKPGL